MDSLSFCSQQSQNHATSGIMKKAKKIGIWMDHFVANLMEFTAEPLKTETVALQFTHDEKERSIGKSENLMHNKEQHRQLDYYKKLGGIITNYEAILLFGPTQAKTELFNVLRADHRFTNIKIELKQTDKLTENQQHAFVKDHFSKHA